MKNIYIITIMFKRTLKWIRLIDIHMCEFKNTGYSKKEKQNDYEREIVDIQEKCNICGKIKEYSVYEDELQPIT